MSGLEQQVRGITDDGTGERVIAMLSGRRGSLGANGLTTDGCFLYFMWEGDIGDLWTMDAQNHQITRFAIQPACPPQY